jgi:hypothetical protein
MDGVREGKANVPGGKSVVGGGVVLGCDITYVRTDAVHAQVMNNNN